MNPNRPVRMWKREYLNPWLLVRQTWRAFGDNQLHARSAQFAYYSMLGLAPLLMVLISALALLPVSGGIQSLTSVLQRSLPADAFAVLQDRIEGVEQASSTGLLLVNLLIFGFAGARLFLTVSEALNVAYGVPARHQRIRAFGISSLLPLIYALLLLVSLALLVVAPMAIGWMIRILELKQMESFLLQAARWIVVTGFLLIFTSTLYCWIPATRVPWRLVTPGNLVAVTGWIIASQGFRFYVNNFANYDRTYGALGGVIALLLWLYLTGAILLLGGQINGLIFGETSRNPAEAAADGKT